jgi:hypothetical protein
MEKKVLAMPWTVGSFASLPFHSTSSPYSFLVPLTSPQACNFKQNITSSCAAYLYLEKVLWRPINLVKALLPRVWHGLHNGPMQIRRLAGRLPGILRVRQFGGGIKVDGL